MSYIYVLLPCISAKVPNRPIRIAHQPTASQQCPLIVKGVVVKLCPRVRQYNLNQQESPHVFYFIFTKKLPIYLSKVTAVQRTEVNKLHLDP